MLNIETYGGHGSVVTLESYFRPLTKQNKSLTSGIKGINKCLHTYFFLKKLEKPTQTQLTDNELVSLHTAQLDKHSGGSMVSNLDVEFSFIAASQGVI